MQREQRKADRNDVENERKRRYPDHHYVDEELVGTSNDTRIPRSTQIQIRKMN